jgi:DNA-binding beta-propeller fold protein YncE
VALLASLTIAAPSQGAKLFVVPTIDPGGPGASGPVFRYDVAGASSSPTLDRTITDATFDRPCCFAFSSSSELFVSNRGDGVSSGAGSITRILDPRGTAASNGTITSAAFSGPHWGVFRLGELFVAQRGANNVLRFSFGAGGAASLNGVISAGLLPNGPRGVAIGPTGELFVAQCCGHDRINRYLVDTAGTAVPNGAIAGNGLNNPNDIAFSPSYELFAANAFANSISRFTFDAGGNASPNGQITGPTLSGPAGLDFSPWGELFVGNAFPPSAVSRWTFDGAGTASFNGSFSTPPDALIDVEFAPEPGAPASRPGKGCGDTNHAHERADQCKRAR